MAQVVRLATVTDQRKFSEIKFFLENFGYLFIYFLIDSCVVHYG